jgi:hypothetical protein
MKLRSAAAALLALALAGCDSEPTIPRSVVGIFDARMVEGEAIPYHRVDGPGATYDILSGTMTLDADGKWRFEIVERLTGPGVAFTDTAVSDGIYSVSGTRIVLRSRASLPEASATATLRNDTLRWGPDAAPFVFTRRR